MTREGWGQVETWAVSPRGAGWLFGRDVTEGFLQTNGLSLIARAHQLVQEGYKYLWDEQLVTVWSCPNYCYRFPAPPIPACCDSVRVA